LPPVGASATAANRATRREQLRTWLPEANLYFENPQRPLPTDLAEIRGDVRSAVEKRAALVATAPVALSPPSPQPGFWYRKKRSNAPRVITYVERSEPCSFGECIATAGDNGESTVSTSEWAIVETRRPDGSWTRFSPPVQPIRWPLRVGDTRSETVSVEDSMGKRTFSVVGYEPVSVPAGSFMAFKIFTTIGGRKFSETWYAPDVRTTVKSVTQTAQGSSIVNELVDYQKSDEPISAIRTE